MKLQETNEVLQLTAKKSQITHYLTHITQSIGGVATATQKTSGLELKQEPPSQEGNQPMKTIVRGKEDNYISTEGILSQISEQRALH